MHYVSRLKNPAAQYAVIAAAAVLMAVNYYVFILPNQFAPSGLGGINTMIQYVFHFSVGYLTLILYIPLAIICWYRIDRSFVLKTLVSVAVFSGVLLLMQEGIIPAERFIYHTEDGKSTLLAPVAAGTVNGIIEAFSLQCGGSTGGMDYISALIHKRKPAYSMTHITFTINIVIAAVSYIVYDFRIEPEMEVFAQIEEINVFSFSPVGSFNLIHRHQQEFHLYARLLQVLDEVSLQRIFRVL